MARNNSRHDRFCREYIKDLNGKRAAAIESLARMLREIPARKAVMHFSSGITRTGNENQAQLRATIDAANQSNVSLYAVDARGLLALPPPGDCFHKRPHGDSRLFRRSVCSADGGSARFAGNSGRARP